MRLQQLSSLFIVKCNCCGKLNNVNTSGHHRTGRRGPKADDINTRAVLGSLHAGIGLTQLSNFLSVLNIPSINSVGNAVEVVARGSCRSNLNLKRNRAGGCNGCCHRESIVLCN